MNFRVRLWNSFLKTVYPALIGLYLLIWVSVGFITLVIGVIAPLPQAPFGDTLQAIGTTWLGIAVAAAYAYFGISPQSADS